MDTIKTVTEWLRDSSREDFSEIPENPVATQLQRLDTANTGIGFVFVMVPITDGSNDVTLDITSFAVFKIKGTWCVILDENISDIACALVRMMIAGITK